MTNATRQAEVLLQEALTELEKPKGSVLVGVQKLLRAATILGEDDVRIWCEIQLGTSKYTGPLKTNVDKLNKAIEATVRLKAAEVSKASSKKKAATKKTATKAPAKETAATKESVDEKTIKDYREHLKTLEALGLKQDAHFPSEEIRIKSSEAGGGYMNIGVVEEMYADILRTKSGNIGQKYYQVNLSEHINYVRRAAHRRAEELYRKVVFSNTPQTSLDILRAEVDDKLLDLAPEIAEKLMAAFRAVASNNPEEWSQALTTCRRFIEDLADILYPPKEAPVNGRKLGKEQYINRLWAFMDESIESDSNKALAKAHVDYLGSYLERIHKVSNKGVHATLARMEAIKAVFHTYLMVADILDYLKRSEKPAPAKLNIHSASLDELESVLNISRDIAKEIVKLRVQHGVLDPALLATIKGVGQKTVSRAVEILSFEPVT